MKLVIVGTGYVGLVSGLCYAEFGFETICVDQNIDKVESLKKGNCPFYEPGIEDLLNNRPRKCLGFKTPKEVMDFALTA